MKSGIFVLSFALLIAGCSKKQEAKKSYGKGGNPLDAPADYLGGLNQAKKLASKTVDLASLQNAIALFNGQEERFPRDLNELVQKHYLQQVPAAPAGQRLTYNPNTGEVKMIRQQ